MDKLPAEFHRQSLELIHHSQKDKFGLSNSVKQLLKEQFFKGEKVLVGDSKELGTIVAVCRGDSPSNKENPPKYSVETQKTYLDSVPNSKLTRVTSFKDSEIVDYINSVAQKPNSVGPWVVNQEHLEKHNIKDKVHPFFAMKRTASSSSSSVPAKKPNVEMNGTGTSHHNDDSSSSDDEPIITAVRKSGVGMAPSSAAAKKITKKLTKPPKPPKEPKPKKSPKEKKQKKSDQSPSKKTKKVQNGTSKSPKKSSPTKEKTKKEGKPKKTKNMNLSEFLSNTSKDKTDSPPLTYEEKMAKRAKDINKRAIKAIVGIDIPSLTDLMERAAKSFPTKFADQIPNEFVRYTYNKAVLKHEQKGKDASERKKIRDGNKDLMAFNEFSYMHRKLHAGKFEDTWVDGTALPEFTPIDCNQNLLFKCIRLLAFLQSYRQTLAIKKAPSLFDFIDSLSDGIDGFWKVTAPILVQVVDFIRRHQRTIPHFNNTGFLNYKIKSITTRSVHEIARKILNPDYNPDAGEDEPESDNESVLSHANSTKSEENGEENGNHSARDNSVEILEENGTEKANGVQKNELEDEEDAESDSEEARIDKQTKEDDELCDRFSNYQLHELSPNDQARILELLIERVEASGPVRDSMRNVDGEVKKLKESLVVKQKKIEKLKDQEKELPPLIPEEEYVNYTRAMTIGVQKANKKRIELEDKISSIEDEIASIREAIEEMRGCSRFRAAPMGYDRFHRRYWFLPPTPGLLIEQGAWTTQPPSEEDPIALPVKPKFNNYDLSTEQLIAYLRTLIGGGYPSNKAPVKWFHIDSVEKLDNLINALNQNGMRESNLKEMILKSRSLIEASFKQRPS